MLGEDTVIWMTGPHICCMQRSSLAMSWPAGQLRRVLGEQSAAEHQEGTSSDLGWSWEVRVWERG